MGLAEEIDVYMTPVEHYRMAEAALDRSEECASSAEVAELLRAQVHATLASVNLEAIRQQ